MDHCRSIFRIIENRNTLTCAESLNVNGDSKCPGSVFTSPEIGLIILPFFTTKIQMSKRLSSLFSQAVSQYVNTSKVRMRIRYKNVYDV